MSAVGSIIIEGEKGEILYASVPGMGMNSSQLKKKAKAPAKRQSKFSVIEIFQTMAGLESDKMWRDRFEKMAVSKFPSNKISYQASDGDDGNIGELIYKNRQIKEKKLYLSKDEDLETLMYQIKEFVFKYTNVDLEEDEDEENFIIIDRSKMAKIKWDKLSPRDQTSILSKYIKSLAQENAISSDTATKFLGDMIIFNVGTGLSKYIIFNEDREIEKITNLRIERGDKFIFTHLTE